MTCENPELATSLGRNDGLIDVVDASLDRLRADGTYDDLLERFFGG